MSSRKEKDSMRTRWVLAVLAAALAAGCVSAPPPDPNLAKCRDIAVLVTVAKRSYQLGMGLPDGTAVTWRDLATCLPANFRSVCPAGGRLEPGPLGGCMKCSVHGEVDGTSRSSRGAW